MNSFLVEVSEHGKIQLPSIGPGLEREEGVDADADDARCLPIQLAGHIAKRAHFLGADATERGREEASTMGPLSVDQ
jgi:hypothetical protein